MRGLLVVSLLCLFAAPAVASDPVALTSEEKLRDVCRGLQPVERQAFPGGVAERGQARAAYEKEQERLRKTAYTIDLAWGAFTVAEWDAEEKLVKLSTEKPFRAFANALSLFDAGREDIELEAVESELPALKAGLAKGTLSLTLLFKPAEEEGAACVVSKARSYAFAIDLLGAELRAGGKPVARSNRDDLSPIPSAHGKPTVEVRAATGVDCPDCASEVVDAVGRAMPELSQCYEAALAKLPTVDGALVLVVQAGKAGELTTGTVVADSVNQGPLLACVKAAIGRARATKPGKAQVVVEFGRR